MGLFQKEIRKWSFFKNLQHIKIFAISTTQEIDLIAVNCKIGTKISLNPSLILPMSEEVRHQALTYQLLSLLYRATIRKEIYLTPMNSNKYLRHSFLFMSWSCQLYFGWVIFAYGALTRISLNLPWDRELCWWKSKHLWFRHLC